MNTTTTVLRGPADAAHYRVQVGRYGDRWYHDPLPADDDWPATEATFPSISIVKKASGSDWSFVAMKRCAETDPERLAQIATLPSVGERYDAFQSINKRGLEAAASRGTGVHLYCEALLNGTSTELIPSGAWTEYRAAVDAFFDHYQPELVAAEYVVINRGLHNVGYGGTPDAIVRIQGELWALDWKSRGPESSHGAYPEEADQVAAGLFADYMIVEGLDGPERRPIPEVAGGLIISIKPDGCRPYPIDPIKTLWVDRHGWWCARRSEREAIGRQWAPAKRATRPTIPQADPVLPTDLDRRQNLRERCRAIAVDVDAGAILRQTMVDRGLAIDTATATQLDDIEALVQQGERAVSAPFNDLPPAVNEGPVLGDDDPLFLLAQQLYGKLLERQASWVTDIMSGHLTLSLRALRSQRRARLLCALSVLAAENVIDEMVVHALLDLAGAPGASRTAPLAEAVAMCDTDTADRLVHQCYALTNGNLIADFTEDGQLVLRPEANPQATKQGATQP